MLDFEIQRCSRRCAKTERDFAAGETFYSVLTAEGAEVVRRDYCEQAWEGPPAHSIGWWKSQMPEANARRANWAPNDVMLHYFQQLESQPGQEDVRYILTLLMIRRRVIRLEDTETDGQGRENLIVYCPRSETQYQVPVVTPDTARAAQIQDDLARLLFAEPSVPPASA